MKRAARGLSVEVRSPLALCYYFACTRIFMGQRAEELCESRGGRPGLPFLLNKPTVSVDVKQHSTNQNGNNRIELSGTEARTQAAMLLLLLLFKGPQSTCRLFWRL